ncbi:MAG: YdcH family protein [Acidisphaera sp.]|nr:YdcH family protein [Acidisphaera sp.]
MSLQSRIESLKTRHASLESRIAAEDHRPRPDADALARLKLEKLRLKDELERLRGDDR